MKSFSIVLGVLLCLGQAQAETNAVRSMNLRQAIDLAVEHNLDVQVKSYLPLIDRFNLQGLYGAYDVNFSAKVQETYGARPASIDPTTDLLVPDKSFNDLYSFGFAGATPWGLQYDLSSTVNHFGGNTFGTNGFFVPISADNQTFVGLTLTQPLLKNLWIDQPRHDILIARKTIKYDELAFRNQAITTVRDTEVAYYNLIYAFENVKVQQKAVELAEQLLAENRRKVEVGTLAPLDEKQAESQVASTKADLIAALGTLESQQIVLKNLITDQFGDWARVSISPAEKLLAIPEVLHLQECWETGLKMRPDLLQAKINLEKGDVDVRFRRNQVYPELDLIGQYGSFGGGRTVGEIGSTFSTALSDLGHQRFPTYFYGAQVSVPLSNRAARNAYKSSKAALDQSRVQFKQVEQGVLVDIDNTLNTVNTTFQRVGATRKASEYAELALEAEQKKLEVGKSTSFVVLTLQSELTTARSAEIRALADYNIALAQLAFAEGSTLEKYHLDVRSR